MLRSLPVQRPSLLLDVRSRWTRRHNISRDSVVGVSLSVSYLPLPRALLRLHMSLAPCRFSPIKVRFLITWEAVEHDGPYVF